MAGFTTRLLVPGLGFEASGADAELADRVTLEAEQR
jgi:hypothetical protein